MTEHQKELKGFRLSPNPYVRNLEEHLGINFLNPPSRIKMDLYNWAAAAVSPLITRGNFDFYRLFLNFGPFRWNCTYATEYNAFFDKANVMFGAHHENMHAYVAQLNPEIYQLRRSADPETSVVAGCLDEGIAEWGAIKTGLSMSDATERKFAISEHNLWLSKVRDGRRLRKETNFAISQIKVLEEYIAKKSKDDYKALSAIKWSKYSAGYYFVYSIMEILSKGAGEKAIDLLILTPPTKLTQIQNPQAYALHLLHK